MGETLVAYFHEHPWLGSLFWLRAPFGIHTHAYNSASIKRRLERKEGGRGLGRLSLHLGVFPTHIHKHTYTRKHKHKHLRAGISTRER